MVERVPAGIRHGPAGDVLLCAVSAVLAAGLAAVTIYHGHRVWGLVSAVGYAAGSVVTLAAQRRTGGIGRRQRLRIAAGVFVVSALVPLAVLVVQRMHGVPWSAQPEVEVVERMARLLLDTGTPYADVDALGRAVDFRDFSPYLPAMAVFGIPRALAGDHAVLGALTDARLVFAAAAALLVLLAVRRRHVSVSTFSGRPGVDTDTYRRELPVRAVQLVAVLPATTLTLATGGDDLPVLGLLVLALVCCHVGRTGAGAIATGAALAMKLTAAPVLLVLTVAVHAGHSVRADARADARAGARKAAAFAATAIGVAAALVLVPLLIAPADLVEHVIGFPAGLTGVESPAASPLPGYLLASSGDAGRAAAIGLLGLAAVAVLVWVLRWPPRSPAQAAERAAVGLVVAMLLMPATRYGYLVYPLVLAGAAIALPAPATRSEEKETTTIDHGAESPAAE